MATKSFSGHNHNTSYYTKSEIEELLKNFSGEPSGTIKIYAGVDEPNGYLICDGRAVSRTTYADLFAAIGTRYGSGNGSTTFNIPNLKGKVIVGYDSADASFNTLGKTGGSKTHTLTISEMPSHTHTQNAHNHIQNPHNHTGSSGNQSTSHTHSGTTSSAGSHGHTGRFKYFNGMTSGSDWAVLRRVVSEDSYDGTVTITHTDAGAHTHTMTTGNQSASHNHTITINNTTPTNVATTATNNNTGGGGAHNNLQPYIVFNYIIKY
jgi:microcystin-dependent protein